MKVALNDKRMIQPIHAVNSIKYLYHTYTRMSIYDISQFHLNIRQFGRLRVFAKITHAIESIALPDKPFCDLNGSLCKGFPGKYLMPECDDLILVIGKDHLMLSKYIAASNTVYLYFINRKLFICMNQGFLYHQGGSARSVLFLIVMVLNNLYVRIVTYPLDSKFQRFQKMVQCNAEIA